MTVRELIDLLRTQRQDARVVIPGYEGGSNDVKGVGPPRIRVDVSKSCSYWGDHDNIHEDDTDEPFDEIAVGIA